MARNEIRTGSSVRVEVPASSANLGPGFDSLGLAFELRDVLEVQCTDEGLRIEVEGEGADEVPRDAAHLIHRSMCALWDRLETPYPHGMHLSCVNAVPHSRGLGSSAAAAVAGVAAAYALTGRALDEEGLAVVSDVASGIEGHPDNASASVYGGYTISWWSGSGWRTARPAVHPDVRAVALVPETTLSTDAARGALPPTVPLHSAAQNAGRAALLTHAMTADPSLLPAATAEWLHQESRRPAYPASMALVDRLRGEGLAAFVSGAGPSVMVLGTDAHLDRLPDTGASWKVLRNGIADAGLRVRAHSG